MDRTRVGFALFGVAALLWIAVSLDSDGLFLAGLTLLAAGAWVAAFAWPGRPGLAGGALVAAALGVVMFYDFAVFVRGLASVAGGVVAVGCLLAAAGLCRSDARLRLAGALAAAAGAALWVYTDGVSGATQWQPGNVLAVVAWAFVATDARP